MTWPVRLFALALALGAAGCIVTTHEGVGEAPRVATVPAPEPTGPEPGPETEPAVDDPATQ